MPDHGQSVFPHLTGAMRFWFYKAPPGRWHQPRRLEDNIEEIEVIVRGRGYFELGGKVVDVGPGSSVWYLPGDMVVVTAHESEPYQTVVFRFEVDGRPLETPPPHSEWTDPVECDRFCLRALELYHMKEGQNPETVFCHYARLTWEYREHLRRGGENRLPQAVRLALRLIEERYQEQLEVSDIAAAAGTSCSHLHLLFRKHLGASPVQRLISRRLQAAQSLLGIGGMSVKEVCFASGFRDFPYFCALFKRRTGLTPTRYASRL